MLGGRAQGSGESLATQGRAPAPGGLTTSIAVMKPGLHKAFNLWIAIAPFLGFAAALVLLWDDLVTPLDLAILAVLYCVQATGITMGYHRLFAHRSFETYRTVRHALAIVGSMAGQGPPIIWTADHRKHHAFADVD